MVSCLRLYIFQSEGIIIMRKKNKLAAILAACALLSGTILSAAVSVHAEDESEIYEEPESSVYEEISEPEPSYEEPESSVYEEISEPEYSYEEESSNEYEESEISYEEPSYEDESSYEEPEESVESVDYYESSYYEEYYEEESEISYVYEYESSTYDPYYYNEDSAYYGEETSFFATGEESPESYESSEEKSSEMSIDDTNLTSKDWDEIQKQMDSQKQNKSSAYSEGHEFDDIKNNKDDGKGQNDSWIYLATGIPLILIGLGIITAVVVFNIKAKKSASTENDVTKDELISGDIGTIYYDDFDPDVDLQPSSSEKITPEKYEETTNTDVPPIYSEKFTETRESEEESKNDTAEVPQISPEIFTEVKKARKFDEHDENKTAEISPISPETFMEVKKARKLNSADENAENPNVRFTIEIPEFKSIDEEDGDNS